MSVPKREDLPQRLRELSASMLDLGIDMEYIGGLDEIGAHGVELQGAARIARTWADGIDVESKRLRSVDVACQQ